MATRTIPAYDLTTCDICGKDTNGPSAKEPRNKQTKVTVESLDAEDEIDKKVYELCDNCAEDFVDVLRVLTNKKTPPTPPVIKSFHYDDN